MNLIMYQLEQETVSFLEVCSKALSLVIHSCLCVLHLKISLKDENNAIFISNGCMISIIFGPDSRSFLFYSPARNALSMTIAAKWTTSTSK